MVSPAHKRQGSSLAIADICNSIYQKPTFANDAAILLTWGPQNQVLEIFVLKSRRPLLASTKRGAIAPTPLKTARRRTRRDGQAADMRLRREASTPP